MPVTVSGLFATREDAERAAAALMDHGVDREEISLLTRGAEGEYIATREEAEARPSSEPKEGLTTTSPEDAQLGAGLGAGVGAAVGVVAGAVSLMVPGFGLVLASGPLAWALGGAAGATAAGAVAGGVFGSLHDLGADDQAVHDYEEGLRQGSTFLSARSDELRAVEMRDILIKYNATNVRDYVSTATTAPSAPSAPTPDVSVNSEVAVTRPSGTVSGSVWETQSPKA